MKSALSNARDPSNGDLADLRVAELVGRKPVRAHLRDGIEAPLRADPEALANCRPRTVLGLIVRALVLAAGRGKMTALKLMMQLLKEEGEDERLNSLRQGISQGILEKTS